MATTNLSLATIASTDDLSAFPTTFNGNMNTIDENAGASAVTFTEGDGITSSLSIRKSGKVVTVNGYVQASDAFGTSSTLLGTIASGSRPTDTARFLVEFASQAYNVGVIGYGAIGTNGQISVKAPSGNTGKYCYFSCSYIIA